MRNASVKLKSINTVDICGFHAVKRKKEEYMDLSTKYMGMSLKNPIIVGSSGLTSSVERVKSLEACGAGAVVLKSIFEEEIMYEYADFMKTAKEQYGAPQSFDYDGQRNPIEYYDYIIREENLKNYILLIEKCKQTVSIPVMASINL